MKRWRVYYISISSDRNTIAVRSETEEGARKIVESIDDCVEITSVTYLGEVQS